MDKTCVIIGGGSGIGLSTAKQMPHDRNILLSGRDEKKLQKAVDELENLGISAFYKVCDVAKREEVIALAEYATKLGEIKNVINSAGVSPTMNVTEDEIIRINSLGTVYVNQEFSKLMMNGSVIVDIASMNAYLMPEVMYPKDNYELAETNECGFIKKLLEPASIVSDSYKKKCIVYNISKNFVVWYSAKSAFEYGKKGIRVVSLSPGLISTDMGNLEFEGMQKTLRFSTEGRRGTPEELGFAIASLADERNSYLAAVDIVCDGGVIRGMKEFRKYCKSIK